MKSRLMLLGSLVFACLFVGRADSVREVAFPRDLSFDVCTRDVTLAVTNRAGPVELVGETFLIHAPGDKLFGTTAKTPSGRKRVFSGDRIGKKIFTLEDSRSRGACLAVFGGAGQAVFNGHEVVFTNLESQPGWSFASIPAAWLILGTNALVMTKGFSLSQDRTTDPPTYSETSHDGGKTWSAAAGGEFLINLRLLRYPLRGFITSPVIDLLNPSGAPIIAPLNAIEAVDVHLTTDTPQGTAIELETRSGGTPFPDSRWSPWGPAIRRPSNARYYQWRTRLSTSNPLMTPVLSNVTVQVQLAEKASSTNRDITLIDLVDYPVVVGSTPYGFQRPSRRLRQLRQQYRLDDVVAAGETDFDRLVLLRNWVRRQWRSNDGFGGSWNALEILAAPPGGKGMCVHFANVFSQCALALGYCARPVIINAHFIADVWSDDHGRWVAMDVEGFYLPFGPKRYDTAHYVRASTHEPLSVLDVHRSYYAAVDGGKDKINDVIQVYTYDEDTEQAVSHDIIRPTGELRTFSRVGYPSRNDHLDREEPWEEYHGQGRYRSQGYLWWRTRPEAPQYAWTSDRIGDFEWTINRVALGITAGRKHSQLTVTVKTFTPNFDMFLYRIDGGDWKRSRGRSQDLDLQWSEITWRLHPGDNLFEVKIVNRFGREGAVSRAEVDVQ